MASRNSSFLGRRTLHLFVVLAVAWMGSVSARTAAAAVPPLLADTGELAENAYDAARDGDWPTATRKVAALRDATKRLKSDPGQADDKVRSSLNDLATQLDRLQAAIGAKDRLAAMKAANRMTLTVAEATEPFHPTIPVDVTRLDYLGRELEIGVAEKDAARLSSTARAVDQTWSGLRADILKHGGEKEARAFAALVSKVTAARTVADYAAVVKPILDEVDNLEKVYK